MASVSLQGRAIAITGASSGIGAATAIACASAGMHVALLARRPDKLAHIAELCRQAGSTAAAMSASAAPRIITVEGDVADPAACKRLVDDSISAFGSLYSIYANAGYGFEKPMHETSEQELRQIFEVNFFGTMNTIRPALEHMLTRPFSGDARRAPRGHVLICSSCLSKFTLPRYGAYSATKAAQNHIGRAMRHELDGKGIAVSTVHPISTSTEFFDVVKARTGKPELATHTPGFFVQSAERVANCTVACLRHPHPEVWTGIRGGITLLGASVLTLLPSLPDVLFRGMASGNKH